jgi:hypothetical protein
MKNYWAALLLGLPLFAGCGNTITVQGTVAYEGNPVEDGHINFVPVNGQGPGGGAPIKNGRYRLAGLLTPGSYKVHFTGNRMVPAAKDARLPSNIKPGDLMPIGDLIPADAVGNFQVVEILAAKDALNFDLKKPAP